MTDNFERYRDFISMTEGLPENNEKGTLDKYYVIELMRRGKDNPDLPAANYHFKNYYIYSWKDFYRYKDEIINICNLLKLRAYGSVNYKLMSQVTLDTLAELSRRVALHDFKKPYSIFESCSGKYVSAGNHLWIVDVDGEHSHSAILNLKWYINKMKSGYTSNVIYTMPTKSGVHLICRPFNLQDFNYNFKNVLGDQFSEIPDVKKNHLTLIYENV